MIERDTYTVFKGVRVNRNPVQITFKHDLDYMYAFRLQAGCVDEHISIDQMKDLHRIIGAALRLLKKVEQ